jgi:cold shock CspA family protein
MKGIVRNIVIEKYYGFILGENGQEYFFHKDDLNDDWDKMSSDHRTSKNKLAVTFEPAATPKGPRARNVELTQTT